MAQISEVHRRLREATKALHKQLDSLAVLAAFRGQNLNRLSYLNALTRLYEPHHFLEQRVIRAIQQLRLDYPYQARSHLLAADIEALGGECPADCSEDFSVDVKTASQVVGCLYLLEGSRLGSAFIARKIAVVSEISGASRFFSEGVENGCWQGFLGFANEQLASADNLEQAEVAAQQAFGFYINSVQQSALETV